MERNYLHDLEALLGIYPPWSIQSVERNDEARTLNVFLAVKDQKKLFGILKSSKSSAHTNNTISGSWRYTSVGSYSCVVHAELPHHEQLEASPLNHALIEKPAFMGSPLRKYSNFLRQQVAIARLKGADESLISQSLHIDSALYTMISSDIDASGSNLGNLLYLPTENDGIWETILRDKMPLRTSVLPLKFLLSKLKLATSSSESLGELHQNAISLRNFFIANIGLLDEELDQICGVNNEQLRRKASAAKSKQRLVLPSIKNPVWINLLTGKLKLNSQSVPLNLLISRQRSAFIRGESNHEKIHAIEVLREYFRKNYRNLKPELMLLNRAITISKSSSVRLPDPDHAVWQKILRDNNFVASDNMAYKLLLAKLRTQIHKNNDPVTTIAAARSIRDFMKQNQKTMQRELSVLFKQSNAI